MSKPKKSKARKPRSFADLAAFLQYLRATSPKLKSGAPVCIVNSTTTPPSEDMFAPKGTIYLVLSGSDEEGDECTYLEPLKVGEIYLTELDIQVRPKKTEAFVAAAVVLMEEHLKREGFMTHLGR